MKAIRITCVAALVAVALAQSLQSSKSELMALHDQHMEAQRAHMLKGLAHPSWRRFGAQQSTGTATTTTAAPARETTAAGSPGTTAASAPQTTAAVDNGPRSEYCRAAGTNSTEIMNVKAWCGNSTDMPIDAMMTLTNFTLAARNEITTFCAPQCLAAWDAAKAKFPTCFDVNASLSLSWGKTMCQQHEGQICALRLRSVGRIESCTETANKNSFTNCTALSQCRWNVRGNDGHGECEAAPSVSLLTEACTPCYDRYTFIVSAAVKRFVPDPQLAFLAASLQLAQKNMFCAKVDTTFCFPVVATTDPRLLDFKYGTNISMAEVRNNLTNLCAPVGKQCTFKIESARQTIDALVVQYFYPSCLAQFAKVSQDPATLRDAKILCGSIAVVLVIQSNARVGMINYMCKKNAADEWCTVHAHAYTNATCNYEIEKNKVCTTECASWATNQTRALGCCAEEFHRTVLAASYPDAAQLSVLPREINTLFAGERQRANWTNHPLYSTAKICNATTGFNETLFHDLATVPCVQPQPIRREMKLSGMRWNLIENNATLKLAIEAALRRDVARMMGTSEANINGTLVADLAQKLTTAATSRRQTANTTSGTKYDFKVTGDSAADAAAAAASFDKSVATGSTDLTATATIVQQECTTCVGSPVATTPGETPAPPPTGNLFAALAGRDATGATPAPPTTTASPAAAQTIAAVVVAAVVAMMTL